MYRFFALSIIQFLLAFSLLGQSQGPISISENQRFFQNQDGSPFFWMADTAWELFHRTTLDEAIKYLEVRSSQGFNVIQAVALAEIDGLNTPNSYGEVPFHSIESMGMNEKYWKYVDNVIEEAAQRNIHIALLPTWGDKLFKNSWGIGPEIFNESNAYTFGQWIGKRYANQKNLIWVLGGDRNPREVSNDVAVWNKMAQGIKESSNPDNAILMTFHPQPNWRSGSSKWFHESNWLDFNMHQSGHCPNQPTYHLIEHDYNLLPIKPTLDGEPLYEEHPNCFNARELGYSQPDDIRRISYWNVFAGAAGQTYGCHAVWQLYTMEREPINGPLKPWQASLDLPMANQMKHLKHLMLSVPYFSRIPDATLIKDAQDNDDNFVIATRDIDYSYALVYFPTGKFISVDLSKYSGFLTSKWYDPRTGIYFPNSAEIKSGEINKINPPSSGKGNDWVLVIQKKGN
jgi:hypothetical protein